MSNLSRAGIDLDQMRVARVYLQHEIKTVDPRKIEATGHFFSSRHHFGVFGQAHDTRRACRIPFVNDLEMKTGQNLPFPASHCAGGLAARNEHLSIHYRAMSEQ